MTVTTRGTSTKDTEARSRVPFDCDSFDFDSLRLPCAKPLCTCSASSSNGNGPNA